jgi:3-dehydroquinate synthase
MAVVKSSSQLVFLDALPLVDGGRHSVSSAITAPETALLIYDRKLEQLSREFRAWTKKFPHRYGVDSGERLKEISQFPGHVAGLSEIAKNIPPRSMTVVVAGGGSVGDFAGFFASVYKRGVGLIQVPTTWLAAIDSSHGGKTALNNGAVKNQIGTFYSAEKVVLVQSILLHQPEERVWDAMGELGKIALIDGGMWVRRLERSRLTGSDLLWAFLKPAIHAKMKVVAKDPFEKSGVRQVLNLGHTVGHVLEAAHGWAHGYAVAQGLFFALEYSIEQGFMKPHDYERAMRLLTDKMELRLEVPTKPIPSKRFLEVLLQDKKKTASDKVMFIFPIRVGKTERRPVPVNDLLREARRQGWVSKR